MPKIAIAAKAPAKRTTSKAKAATPAKATAKAKAPAKLTAAQADIITTSMGTSNGTGHHVSSAGGDSMSFPTAMWKGEMRAAAKVGASFAACVALHKKLAENPAKLATGVTGRDAPHASKAVADGKAKSAPAAKATAPAAKPAKAAKAAKPAKGADRPYKALAKLADMPAMRPDSWRLFMVTTILAHKSTAAAQAACDKSNTFRGKKLDFSWSARSNGGFIAFTD